MAKNTKPATEAAAAKKRAQTHCKNGHPLNSENLYNRRNGRRVCKICKSDSWYMYILRTRIKLKNDPNDPRHGTRNGYNCGCRCNRCGFAASEYYFSRKTKK